MPFLSNLIERPRRSGDNLALTEGFSSRFWGTRSAFSTRVSEEEAVEFTAVYRALNIIASTLGTLPLHVFDARKSETDHVKTAATKYLWGSPNREETRFTLWSGLFADQVMDGNAFIKVVKNANGEVLQLWAIEPHRVEVGRMGADYSYLKVYRIDNKEVLFDYSAGGEIVHIPGRPDNRNRLVGFSPRRSLYRALGVAKAAEEYAGRHYSNDSVPPGVLSSDQVLSKEQAEALQERWEERHGGGNKGRVAVLGHGTTFQPVTISPQEAQLLDSRKFSVTEIFRHFGIPSHLGNDTEKTTSWGSGLFELTRGFQAYTLAHTYIPFEMAIDKHLLGGGDLYVRFELGQLLRGSKLEQYQAHRLALAGQSWMTVNEVRALDELPPIEGGDVLATPLNMGTPGSLPGDTPVGDTADPKKALSNGHIDQTRCPDCNKLLGMGLQGIAWCVRCKGEKVLV